MKEVIISVIVGWLVGCMFGSGIWIGSISGRQYAYIDYCEFQDSEYLKVDDIPSCIKDNKIIPIEWVRKGK